MKGRHEERQRELAETFGCWRRGRLVLGKFAGNLVKHGGWVVWHTEGYREEGSPFTGIPAGCQGVICLIDMIDHGSCNKATEAAADALRLAVQGTLDDVGNGLHAEARPPSRRSASAVDEQCRSA